MRNTNDPKERIIPHTHATVCQWNTVQDVAHMLDRLVSLCEMGDKESSISSKASPAHWMN